MLQRVAITEATSENGCVAVRPGALSRGPRPDNQAIAIMPAAATPQVHHGLPRPWWRELKKWRMTGPIASTIATMSQLNRVANRSGEGLLIIRKTTGSVR